MRIELELQSSGNLPLDLGTLRPSELVSLTTSQIEKLNMQVAGRPSRLGEHFKLRRFSAGRDELVLRGDTGRIACAGRRMQAGRLVIEGDAGPLAGAEMEGGELQVSGNAGDCLGAAMCGGLIRVRGNAGNGCGAALPGQVKGMCGGMIIVEGNVGAESGAGMCRGLLVIGGDSGEYTGLRILAGTILCLGQLGPGAGLEMKRGSLVAGKSRTLLPGFRLTGEADTEWLRITLAWLRRLALPCPPYWDLRPPRRFTGDHLGLGKGEVLIYEILE